MKVREILEKPDQTLYTTGLIIAEVCSKYLKEKLQIPEMLNAIRIVSSLVAFDYGIAQDTAQLYVTLRKTKPKFGIVDAHVVASARSVNAQILTCDNDFVDIADSLVIR